MREDGEGEAENSFGAMVASLRADGRDRTKYVVKTCGEEIVLIAEVQIKGGPADIGAIKDLLDSNRVVVSFVNQRMESIAQELLRSCDASVWRPVFLGRHLSPSGA